MKDTNLVDVLRAYEEWAEWNHQETPIAMGDNLAEAADLIEAQAKEIEKLRAQASPVVHGRWIPHDRVFGDDFLVCSKCQFVSEDRSTRRYYHYCPHCGAKMDGGDDNACL